MIVKAILSGLALLATSLAWITQRLQERENRWPLKLLGGCMAAASSIIAVVLWIVVSLV